MRYRLFGKTCVKVSEIGFGGRTIGGDAYGAAGEDEAVRALRTAYDLGCNLFDTSEDFGNGRGETLLAEALGPQRAGVLLATGAVGDPAAPDPHSAFRKEHLLAAIDRSLARLRTGYIDLYHLRSPGIEVLRAGDVLDTLDELKAAGKIRWAGASVETPEEALAAIETGRFESIQVRFNLADRRMLAEVFPAAKRARVGIVVREPLAGGFLAGRFGAGHRFPEGDIRGRVPEAQRAECARIAEAMGPILGESTETRVQLALKYVLAFDAVAATLVGIRTEAQLEEAAEAAIGDPMRRDEFEAVQRVLEGR
jgi:aryl-alcohol dehydrogenase-like predicted oxidoreductase